MVEFTCCSCKETFKCLAIDEPEEAEGATMDCPHCEKLLIYKDGEIKDFHKWLHNQTVEDGDGFVWPEDGKGTGYIDL